MILPISSVIWIGYSISALLVSAAPLAEPVWKIWNIDPQPISGSSSSCAFLPGGRVIIGYENRTRNQTKVAMFDGKIWKTDVVADALAEGISVAAASSGKVFVSSIDSRSKSLRISTFDMGKWDSEVIDSENRYIGPTSVALTQSNDPRIFVYTLGVNSLRIFANHGGVWVPQVVNEPGGYQVSGAVSAKGLLACASMNGTMAMLSLSKGKTWTHYSFKGLGKLNGPNALDFNGDSLPVFVVSGLNGQGLNLSTFSDGEITSELLEQGVPTSSASIEYSADGHPAVAYVDRSDSSKGLLKVATRIDGRWSIETVDRSAGGGWQTCVAWGPNGDIGVSYYNQESRTLKFALKPSLKKSRTGESDVGDEP